MLLQPKNETEKATKIQEKIKLLKRNLVKKKKKVYLCPRVIYTFL